MKTPIEICLVDDNPNITELLECHFLYSKVDCKSVSFNDPQKAIDYISHENSLKVLITDYHMGEISGYDVIKSTPDDICKIVISGNVDREEMNLISSENAIFFDKPIDMNSLASAILDYIKKV